MIGPTIQRRRLGIALRQAREQPGKTQDEAAAVIHGAASKISRIEAGVSGLRVLDLNALIEFYGVPSRDAETMRELAKAGRQRGRWSTYRDSLPSWFRQYVDLESDASELRWYQTEIVPGVLQTEAYVRSLFDISAPRPSADETNKAIKVRLERLAVIEQAETEAFFILSESVLRRRVGSNATMSEQLRHLATDRPNVEIQILPFNSDTYSTASFPFTMLRFGGDSSSDVVYAETLTDADYLDRPEAVRVYLRLWDRLRAAALGPVESRRLILSIADEVDRRPK
jgi:transcriptional regulator with XRE-family HTH domain